MDRIERTIEVDAAPSVCYQKWHHFEQFPHFMKDVQDVRRTGEKRWHWVVNGPLGHRSEWDAEVDGDEPNNLISWHSLTGSEVTTSGVVHFKDLGQNKTQVVCQVQYDPPAGALGEVVAHVFMHPEHLVEENLASFKHLVEGTNVPVDKVQTGRHMQPDPFVVPSASSSGGLNESKSQPASASGVTQAMPSAGTANTGQRPGMPGTIDEDDYELIYGLEDDLPEVGTSSPVAGEDIGTLEELNEEESPYLGLSDGAVYSEDLIDMRNDNSRDMRATDIYSESMDVFEEDLASYTENLDSDIDAGLGPRAFEEYGPNGNAGLGPRESMPSPADKAWELNSGSKGENS